MHGYFCDIVHCQCSQLARRVWASVCYNPAEEIPSEMAFENQFKFNKVINNLNKNMTKTRITQRNVQRPESGHGKRQVAL